MSRSLDELKKPFRRKVETWLSLCEQEGLGRIEVYDTGRSLAEQARMFRKGKGIRTIRRRIGDLNKWNPGLGDILREVGPQFGKSITNAGPGQSAHFYGIAIDMTPVVGGEWWPAVSLNWKLWTAIIECAEAAGLEAGFHFKKRDAPHLQEPGFNWRDHIAKIPKKVIQQELELLRIENELKQAA